MVHKRKVNLETFQLPQVNLTPLLDIIFVILIGLLLIMPFLGTERIQLASGNEETLLPLSSKEKQSLRIYLREDQSIYLEREKISFHALLDRLTLEKKRSPQLRLLLFPDRRVHFGIYQEVKNVVEKAGFLEIEVVLSPAGEAKAL